jgi:NTE family protein
VAFHRLHLYDGGVYDNLGLEPFFDAGRQRPKREHEFIICSDAGSPLAPGFNQGQLNVFRLKRVADIMSDQSRSLRVRAFAQYLQQTPSGGAYLFINTPISSQEFCPSAQFAASFPTTLRRLDHDEFDRLAAHGHAVAERFRNDYGLL